MTVTELADLVRRMRDAQRRYFRTRSGEDLDKSKALEREVDLALETALAPPGEKQGQLFDGAAGNGPYQGGG